MRDERPERALSEPTLEQALIGACLLLEDVGTRRDVQRYVTAECFTRTLYREAWRLISAAWDAGQRPDVVTIATEAAPIVGVEFAVALDRLGAPMDDPYCWGHTALPRAQVLRRLAQRRSLIAFGAETTRNAYSEEDVAGVLAYTARLAELIDEMDAQDETGDVGAIAAEVERRADSGEARGWPSGVAAIDAWRGGLHPGEVYVVGAPTGVGKTWLLGQIANAALDDGRRVAFVSLEMDVHEIYVRLAAGRIGFKAFRLSGTARTWAREEHDEYAAAREVLTGARLRLYNGQRSMAQISAMVRATEPAVVLIDYVQLIEWSAGVVSEYEALTKTMNEVASLAQRCECVVVVATQMARAYQGKPGAIMGGAGAGRIDHAAHLWIRLDREDEPGHLRLTCAKNRHGPTGGEMRCKLDAKSGRIVPA